MKVLVLNDNILLGFARDKGLRELSAEIRRVHSTLVKGGGGCRCRQKRGSLGAALAGLKFAIAHNQALASRLKAHTRAQRLVIHIREGNKIVRKEI